ncbi:MAG: MiaB/RimO family radical SAM methylthiotransferase [Firmicutes bacterium]|nr:MiaB/RimO family radical SAM methylthiotransferase [Bacillota bacterium]
MTKVVVHTLGCKVNQYESTQILDEFAANGFFASDKMQAADIYVINTCAVTKEAERKSRQLCRKAWSLNANAQVFVIGCAVENYCKTNQTPTFAGAIIVTGCKDKQETCKKILDMATFDAVLMGGVSAESASQGATAEHKMSRKYIKIQDGCNKFCSYCIIPHLRGRSSSRSCEEVLAEIQRTDAREIILTGIDVASFGKDNHQRLIDLIEMMTADPIVSAKDTRFRFGSVDPELVDKEFLLALKKNGKFCEHFHLSLQSASDSVLRAMNRPYTIQEFVDKVALTREILGEDVGLTTDIIVGYPTETDKDFETSLQNLEKIKFSDMHIFRYSRREGTLAARLPVLPSETVEYRAKVMEGLRDKHATQFLQQQIGQTMEVYFETPFEKDTRLSKGYARNYCQVVAPCKPFSVQQVTIQKVQDGLLYGV